MAVVASQALQELYRQKSQLLAYIVVITGNLHLAEDVFQEVAVLVVRKADEILGMESLPGWARAAARLEALKCLRRARRLQPLSEAVLDSLDREWEAREDGSDDQVLGALRACLEKLPSSSRRLLACRYAENCSGDELALRVGKSANAVYLALSRIHRALGDCIRSRLAIGGHHDG